MAGKEVRIGGAKIDYVAKDAGFTRATKKVNNQLTGFERKAGRAKAAAAGLTASIGGMAKGFLGFAAVVGGSRWLNNFVEENAKLASRLLQLERLTGLSTDQLQIMRKAFGAVGVQTNTTEKAIKKFSQSLFEAQRGSATYLIGFEKLGISLKDAEGKNASIYEVLLRVGEAMRSNIDATDKAGAAMALFGARTSEVAAALQKIDLRDEEVIAAITATGLATKEQLNILQEYTAGIDTLSDIMETKGIQVAAKYAESVLGIKEAYTELKLALIDSGAVDALASIIKGMSDFIVDWNRLISGDFELGSPSRAFYLGETTRAQHVLTVDREIEKLEKRLQQEQEMRDNALAKIKENEDGGWLSKFVIERARNAADDSAKIIAGLQKQLDNERKFRKKLQDRYYPVSTEPADVAISGGEDAAATALAESVLRTEEQAQKIIERERARASVRFGAHGIRGASYDVGGEDAAATALAESVLRTEEQAQKIIEREHARARLQFGAHGIRGASYDDGSALEAQIQRQQDLIPLRKQDIQARADAEAKAVADARRDARLKQMATAPLNEFGGVGEYRDVASHNEMSKLMAKIAREEEIASNAIIKLSDTTKMRLTPVFEGLDNQLDNFFTSIIDGTASAGDAFKNLASQIAQAVLQALVLQPLVNSITGGIGNFFGIPVEARASGGPVDARSPYLVGEKGPELFVPSHAGTIVPNHRMGGGGNVNQFTFNIESTDGPGVKRALDVAYPIFLQGALDAQAQAADRPGDLYD